MLVALVAVPAAAVAVLAVGNAPWEKVFGDGSWEKATSGGSWEKAFQNAPMP